MTTVNSLLSAAMTLTSSSSFCAMLTPFQHHGGLTLAWVQTTPAALWSWVTLQNSLACQCVIPLLVFMSSQDVTSLQPSCAMARLYHIKFIKLEVCLCDVWLFKYRQSQHRKMPHLQQAIRSKEPTSTTEQNQIFWPMLYTTLQTRSSGKGEEVQLCCQSVETCNATTHRDRTSWPWMETCAKQHSGDCMVWGLPKSHGHTIQQLWCRRRWHVSRRGSGVQFFIWWRSWLSRILDNEQMLGIVGVHVYGSAAMHVGIYLSHVTVWKSKYVQTICIMISVWLNPQNMQKPCCPSKASYFEF